MSNGGSWRYNIHSLMVLTRIYPALHRRSSMKQRPPGPVSLLATGNGSPELVVLARIIDPENTFVATRYTRTVKGKYIHVFAGWPKCSLGPQNSQSPKDVAALLRQGMVENMENTHHGPLEVVPNRWTAWRRLLGGIPW